MEAISPQSGAECRSHCEREDEVRLCTVRHRPDALSRGLGALWVLPEGWQQPLTRSVNNPAERAIRPVAVGRKNWLFAGSDAGGETLADAMTIIETAKLSGLNPEAYLADVLARINDHIVTRLDELLPWNWTPASQQAAQAA